MTCATSFHRTAFLDAMTNETQMLLRHIQFRHTISQTKTVDVKRIWSKLWKECVAHQRITDQLTSNILSQEGMGNGKG